MRERDTGVTHNVSVMGDLTTLTLPNVTSSRVEVSLAASTVKGTGSPSPATSLNLLMTHLKVRERVTISDYQYQFILNNMMKIYPKEIST